ncbi:pseudouridine synthase [bacterium]|nr:pseudouridine synthase [bacterium]
MTRNPARGDDDRLRLNQFLSRAGHGSRRGVESLVRQGRVTIDGEVVRDLARRVDPSAETVAVDGMVARLPRHFRVYAFHKPLGVVSSLRGQGQQVDLAALRERAGIDPRFHPVGRLDQDSSGLLLWTDDGTLSQALLRPGHEVWKTYRIVLGNALGRGLERTLAGGTLELDGRPVRPCHLEADPGGDRRRWTIRLQEGRNRQIRRMLAAVGARVVALERVAFGPIELGRLRPGDFRRLTEREDQALREVAGRTDRSS